MNYPHSMRLAGPWDFEVIRTDAGEPPSQYGRIRLPLAWSEAFGNEFRGVVRLVRRFNRPTNLDPHECVCLEIEGCCANGRASLNGDPLGSVPARSLRVDFDITSRIELNNTLEIEVEIPELLFGNVLGEVRLEIRLAPSSC